MSMFDVPEEIYNNRINKIYGHEEAQSRVYDCEGTQLKVGDIVRPNTGDIVYNSFYTVTILLNYLGKPSIGVKDNRGKSSVFFGTDVKWEEEK